MSSELHIDGRITRAKKLRDARREEILTAAQKIIAELGTAKANVADIIQAAKVSRGTFYLYFDSYDAVLHELTDRFLGQIIDNVRAVRLEDGSPLEQLEENLHRVISLLLDQPDLTRILLRETSPSDQNIDQKLKRLYLFLTKMINGALRNGVRLGFIREVQEEVITTSIIGGIKEVVFQQMEAKSLQSDRRSVTKEILRFWLQGLAKEFRIGFA